MDKTNNNVKGQWEGWLNRNKCNQLLKRWGSYEDFLSNSKNKNKKCIIDTLYDVIDKLKVESILEVGVGCGHFMFSVSSRVKDLFGLDYSNHMIDITRDQFDRRNLSIDLRQGTCLDLPYDDGSIDLAYIIDVTMHVPFTYEALIQMIRVSKKSVILTGPSFEEFDGEMNKQIGKLSWAVNMKMLNVKLDKMKRKKIIGDYQYLDRPKTKVYKHKILVITK